MLDNILLREIYIWDILPQICLLRNRALYRRSNVLPKEFVIGCVLSCIFFVHHYGILVLQSSLLIPVRRPFNLKPVLWLVRLGIAHQVFRKGQPGDWHYCRQEIRRFSKPCGDLPYMFITKRKCFLEPYTYWKTNMISIEDSINDKISSKIFYYHKCTWYMLKANAIHPEA